MRRQHQQLPPVRTPWKILARNVGWGFGAFLLFVVAGFLGSSIVSEVFTVSRWVTNTIALLALVGTPAGMAFGFWLSRRDIGAVITRGGRACIGCGYDLTRQPDSGTCPECGRQYELESLREEWAVMLAAATFFVRRRKLRERMKRNDPVRHANNVGPSP